MLKKTKKYGGKKNQYQTALGVLTEMNFHEMLDSPNPLFVDSLTNGCLFHPNSVYYQLGEFHYRCPNQIFPLSTNSWALLMSHPWV